MNDFTTAFTVDQTPEEVFAAINNVRAWWSGEIEGDTEKLGDEFIYRYGDLHRSSQTVTESIAGKRVVWHVGEAFLSFVEDKTEWVGTNITFDISERDGKTEVRFTHLGLTPGVECFDACSNAWASYVGGSLRSLITTGTGQPNPDEQGSQVV